ncbi:MAG TPA: penicillin-binding protein [Vicinamibacterales bacterium]|nr:penicillin-binding protein [Vicinamibacterales bacterium]
MTDTAAHAWRETLRRRTIITAALIGFWVVGIEARLVVLQVFEHRDLVARATRQQMRTMDAAAERGDILDRKGRVLATSVSADSIYAVPSAIDDPKAVVAELCTAFGDCTPKERESLVERLGKNRQFAYVRREVSPEQAKRVAALNLAGIGSIKEDRRFYPNKELAAHLLGYVGVDNRGLNGVEFTYDRQIRGKAGTVLVQTDARNRAFARFERPPTTGSTVELTIDEYLQHVAERELHAGVVENRAIGGTAIIMNPHTGEILAMANEPTFNPNAYREFDDVDRRNRAVQDLYEPGSTFKVVTASAALEEHVMPIDSLIDTDPGIIKIPGRAKPITEASHHNYHTLSFTDVIVKSSNVGAIKIGFKVGTERLSRYVSLYGFGHPVSPDFPSESSGIVWNPSKWTESALASVSMGYQVAVTPLQMVAAISSVANGGEMMEPRVLRAIYQNGRRYETRPKVVRRVVSPDTAAALTGIMEGVVERGTATMAQMPGFTVAGKTGTAAKLVNGTYSTTAYNASFVGFVPSRNPAVAIIVVTDSPHNGPTTGGPVSGPVFKRIAEATLRYLGVGPTINPLPPVLVARHDDGANDAVRTPSASVSQGGESPTVSFVSDGPPGTMPDLRGLSAREALRTLMRLGLSAHIDGSGVVVAQDPPAGAPLDTVSAGRVTLARTAAALQEQARP